MSRETDPAAPYPTSAFDYPLPRHLIARHPAARRDESRLLVVRRDGGVLEHRVFRELPDLIPAGDALVLNETRVFRARLLGRRRGGGEAEVLLLRPVGGQRGEAWEALVRPGAKLKAGRVVEISDALRIEVLGVAPDGTRFVRLITPLDVETAIERHGHVPLPPYIDRADEPEDAERYQTVYARERGSVAAPTAGLHFTPALLEHLERSSVNIARVILHVGAGTFRPVEVDDPARHEMHAEWFSVPDAAAATLARSRAARGRVWAVGTTVTRALETAVDDAGRIRAASGWTSLFIRPPYQFRAVDRLITNFHLPRSTLLMLVAAFGGHDLVMRAYREAVEHGYRFYSYGDAMVII